MAARRILITATCLLALVDTISSKKLSDWFTPCSLKDPQIAQCIVTQSRSLWPHLAEGVEEWGLLPSDPLLMPKVQNSAGNNNALNMQLTLIDTLFHGYKDIQINAARADTKNFHFELDLVVPLLTGGTRFAINGRILVLPIAASGLGNLILEHVDATFSFDCKPVVLEGKTFLQLLKVYYRINSIKKPALIVNKVLESQELTNILNKFFKDNAQAILAEVKTSVEKELSKVFLHIFDGFFKKFPLEELFTD